MDIVIKIALSLIHLRGRLDFEKDVAHEIWSKLRHFRLFHLFSCKYGKKTEPYILL